MSTHGGTTSGTRPTADISELKRRAVGHWPQILSAVAGIPASVLDCRHYPCPKCQGTDRFRALDDFDDTGAVYCNQCFNENNGDGLAAVMHYAGMDFRTAARAIADYLGTNGFNGNGHKPNGKKAAGPLVINTTPIAPEQHDALLQTYGQAKPPIMAAGVRQCGGALVLWNGYQCIRLDGRARSIPTNLPLSCSAE